MNDLAVTPENALALLEKQDTPESKAIVEYVNAIKKKNIAILGEDEAFVLQDKNGKIKAFKRAVVLSSQAGTLVQPVYKGPFVVSAQGYEVLNEASGTSVIFPKEVMVYGQPKPNPYAERDPNNGRILAVHACAVAFRYSPMGIPQVSAWTTIFDTPSYRMIDLLAKAKEFPQAFRVLPKGMKPDVTKSETWASYPFDESVDLYYDTSHQQVMKWLSQILNREKKAMDFAQTFAKRNASKHLHGIQKAPCDNWKVSVMAWRPEGNNIVKWDNAQYTQLQDRVVGMIEGGSDEFDQKVEIQKGAERTSEEENFEALELTVDPEDNSEQEKTVVQEGLKEGNPVEESQETPKEIKQLLYIQKTFPDQFAEARKFFKLGNKPIDLTDTETAARIYEKVSELVDAEN